MTSLMYPRPISSHFKMLEVGLATSDYIMTRDHATTSTHFSIRAPCAFLVLCQSTMCIPPYVSIAAMSASPFRSLVNSSKLKSYLIASCSRTTSSACWTTSGGLVDTIMAVSFHQRDLSLAHSLHSFVVRMPLLVWRAFSTESRQRDGELTLQRNLNKVFQSKSLTFTCTLFVRW